MMNKLDNLKVKIFADGADINQIIALAKKPYVKGFTTNPTLMSKAGVKNYESFARELLEVIPNHPVSFEVFADDLVEMESQARVIASWGKNVNVKIPVTNTKGEFTGPILAKLSAAGVILNVTAIMTVNQVQQVTDCLDFNTPAIVSVFAGRIADTGRDPIPMMQQCARILKAKPKAELLWASCRELLNIFHAEESHSAIVTVTPDLLNKLKLLDKCLDEYSLETVQMFYNDAKASNFSIAIAEETVLQVSNL